MPRPAAKSFPPRLKRHRSHLRQKRHNNFAKFNAVGNILPRAASTLADACSPLASLAALLGGSSWILLQLTAFRLRSFAPVGSIRSLPGLALLRPSAKSAKKKASVIEASLESFTIPRVKISR